MRICFVTAGPIEWASSRFRAHWVAEHVDGAEVVLGDKLPPPADVYIWQKVANPNHVEMLDAARHIWDVCDPAWWFQPKEARQIADAVGAVVASNVDLVADFHGWYGYKKVATVIPDRMKLEHYGKQREHRDVRPVRFIWFGAGQNRMALFGALAPLERLRANGHNISLTIMDDQPGQPIPYRTRFPLYYNRWSLEQENETMAQHDIALLPPYPGPWGRVKSNNKWLTAWACGLPVTEANDYARMEQLVTDPAARHSDSRRGRQVVQEKYDVKQSANEWMEFLC